MWLVKVEDTIRVGRNENMIFRSICPTKFNDSNTICQLRDKLGIPNVKVALHNNCYGSFGDLECMINYD